MINEETALIIADKILANLGDRRGFPSMHDLDENIAEEIRNEVQGLILQGENIFHHRGTVDERNVYLNQRIDEMRQYITSNNILESQVHIVSMDNAGGVHHHHLSSGITESVYESTYARGVAVRGKEEAEKLYRRISNDLFGEDSLHDPFHRFKQEIE